MKIDCFSKGDLDKVFTLDVYQKDEMTFLETHFELDKIYVKVPGAQTHELKTEEEIIRLITSGETVTGPRIFIIVGDAGTGKSEECRLIAVTAKQSQKYTVEHKPKGLLAFGPLAFIGNELAIYGLLAGSESHKTIVDLLLNACKILLEQQRYGDYWKNIEGKIREGIKRRLDETVQSAKRAQEKPEVEIKPFKIVEGEDFKPYLDQVESERLARAFNEKLANILIAIAGPSSIVSLFKQKIKEEQKLNKRYLLIMDDVTLVGEVFNDILNLISDIGQSDLSCDIVFGITRGRYADLSKILDTLRDRAYEILLTNTNLPYTNASWLFDESSATNFIEKYLRAIKNRNRCILCPSKMCNLISSNELFPFNENFLKNFYSKFRDLAEKNLRALTPRFLLASLKSSIVYFLETGKSPANRICEEWENVEGFIDPARLWLKEDSPSWMKAFVRTCYFYGDVSKETGVEKIKVKKSIIDFFRFNPTEAQKYIGVIQEEDVLVLTRERIETRGQKETTKEKEELDFDEILNEIRRWINSPNIPFTYTPDVREGFNVLLRRIFGDKMRLIKNPNRLSAKGSKLQWKHRKDEVFPFSIGYGREKNEIKLLPITLKESESLTFYVDDEDLVNLVKLKYNPEDDKAALSIIIKHPEIITIGQKCIDITFSQVTEDFLQWILASIIVLSQMYSISQIRESYHDIDSLYGIVKETLSKKSNISKELSPLVTIALYLFTTRDSIMDYTMTMNILSKLVDSDLISVILNFDPEKVESVTTAENIVSNVKNIISSELRLIDIDKIYSRVKTYEEYVLLAKEILENYNDVKSELEKLSKITHGESFKLPEDSKLKMFIADSIILEKFANRSERNRLKSIILSRKITKIGQDHKETLDFLTKINDIRSRPKENYLERYNQLKGKMNLLQENINNLINSIIKLLGEENVYS